MSTRPLLASLLTLVALSAASDAQAVQPPTTTTLGAEPTRARTFTSSGQDALAAHPGWRAFTKGEGAGWAIRWDEQARTPHRTWGPGIDLGPVRTERDLTTALRDLVQRHPQLFGVQGAELRLRGAARVERMHAWYVDVDVLREGLPIWRGGLTFRIKHDRLVMIGADSYPHAPIVNAMRLDRDAAIGFALRDGPAGFVEHTDVEATPYLLPQEDAGKVVLRRVWEVRSRTEVPKGHWVAMVDAETGALVSVHNEVRFLSGTLTAQHDDRLGAGGLTVSPLPFAWVSGSGGSTFTSATGAYTVPNGSYTVSLAGSRVRVFDQLGTVTPALAGANMQLDAADFGGRLAPLTTYVYTHQAQDWGYAVAPEVGFTRARVNAYVNINDVCNAYFDGNVNFFQSGGGCRNTGRLADVVFHEWAHGFHTYSIVSGFYDGSVGEGAADAVSFLITNDSRIAPSFFTSGGGTLRNQDNNARYPQDYVANANFVHSNGLIFGGSIWDTREALRRAYGEPYATRTTSELLAGLLKGGPDITTSFDEAMFADDDDGDLANGTPHLCELIEGFGAHGLGLGTGSSVTVAHEPIVGAPAGQPIPVLAALSNPAGACSATGSTGVGGLLRWRVNGGSWLSAPVTNLPVGVRGTLPALTEGDVVEYWIDVNDGAGTTASSPADGVIRPHTFLVGKRIEVVCSDFEQEDGGFTHQLVAGTNVAGADDWLWGTPRGQSGDPFGAFSGANAWGTDLGQTGWNGAYQDDKHTRLSSPVYDVGHFDGVTLQYRRWLTIEDGFYDRASIWADGRMVWSNWATSATRGDEHHLDTSWALHAVDLQGLADDGAVQLSWELESDGGLTFGGWNIDDVCLFAPATPDNRLAVTDLQAAPHPGAAVRLTWTNPEYGPVRYVVVVRNDQRVPRDWTDGTMIGGKLFVDLGEQTELIDDTVYGRQDVFYAVFPYDGQDFLSWSVLGWNAVQADAARN